MILNKEKLVEAIENYDLLTPVQQKVLSVLVKLELDEEVVLNIKSLAELSKVTRTSTYKALDFFQKIELVAVEPGIRKKVIFKLNIKNLENILDKYKKIQSLEK